MSKDSANNIPGSCGAPFTTLDTTAPVISGVAVSAITGSGATITWTTNEAASSEVEYGLTTAYGSVALNTTPGTKIRRASWRGMAEGTGYEVNGMSKEV